MAYNMNKPLYYIHRDDVYEYSYSGPKELFENYDEANMAIQSRKARRIIKHLSKAPWDGCARAAFEKLSVTAKKGLALPPLAHSPAWERRMIGATLTEAKRALKAS